MPVLSTLRPVRPISSRPGPLCPVQGTRLDLPSQMFALFLTTYREQLLIYILDVTKGEEVQCKLTVVGTTQRRAEHTTQHAAQQYEYTADLRTALVRVSRFLSLQPIGSAYARM